MVHCLAEIGIANARLTVSIKPADILADFKREHRRRQNSQSAAETMPGDPNRLSRDGQSVDNIERILSDYIERRSKSAMHQAGNDTGLNAVALAKVNAVVVYV